MIIKLFVIVLILLGLSLVGLGIGMLLKRNGRFPETHIGRNYEMKKRGIHCANTTDAEDRKNYRPIGIQKEEKR